MSALTNKQKVFLEAYISNLGNVSKTCEAVGVSRETYYRWKKEKEEFDEALTQSKDCFVERLREEALKRALGGSDSLLKFMLESLEPNTYDSKRRQAGGVSLQQMLRPIQVVGVEKPIAEQILEAEALGGEWED